MLEHAKSTLFAKVPLPIWDPETFISLIFAGLEREGLAKNTNCFDQMMPTCVSKALSCLCNGVFDHNIH